MGSMGHYQFVVLCMDSRGSLVTRSPGVESLESVEVTRSLIVWFLNQVDIERGSIKLQGLVYICRYIIFNKML